MNDIAYKLTSRDPAASYVDQADQILVDLNKRIVDLDASWRRQRRELSRRYHDEIISIDQQHAAARAKLTELVERIELLQE